MYISFLPVSGSLCFSVWVWVASSPFTFTLVSPPYCLPWSIVSALCSSEIDDALAHMVETQVCEARLKNSPGKSGNVARAALKAESIMRRVSSFILLRYGEYLRYSGCMRILSCNRNRKQKKSRVFWTIVSLARLDFNPVQHTGGSIWKVSSQFLQKSSANSVKSSDWL